MIKDGMLPWLETALEAAYRRHNVLSSNLANVETPGYTARDLEFEDQLRSALDEPEAASSSALPEAVKRPGAEVGLDGNAVDLDTEVAAMTSNRLFYDLATEVISRRIALLRYAINEGGR